MAIYLCGAAMSLLPWIKSREFAQVHFYGLGVRDLFLTRRLTSCSLSMVTYSSRCQFLKRGIRSSLCVSLVSICWCLDFK